MLTSAIDFLSDDSLPPELRTISVKLSDFRQQFDSITGLTLRYAAEDIDEDAEF